MQMNVAYKKEILRVIQKFTFQNKRDPNYTSIIWQNQLLLITEKFEKISIHLNSTFSNKQELLLNIMLQNSTSINIWSFKSLMQKMIYLQEH